MEHANATSITRYSYYSLAIPVAGTADTVFRHVSSEESGIDFANFLVESDTLNALTFEYIYNGAGTGIADFNNDSLTDIFFAGNVTSCKLFLNKGNLTFDDVTSTVGTSQQKLVYGRFCCRR